MLFKLSDLIILVLCSSVCEWFAITRYVLSILFILILDSSGCQWLLYLIAFYAH